MQRSTFVTSSQTSSGRTIPVSATIDYFRQAPISLVLGGLAVLFFAIPQVGSSLEFHFTDFLWPDPFQNLVHPHAPWSVLAGLQLALRMVGCNWLHWSANHLFWDLLTFYVVGRFCERHSRAAFLWTTIVASASIPAIVMITTPELASYRGLSGIDTALFALLATTWLLTEIRRQQWARSLVFLGLLLGMAAKIAYEMTAQQTLFVSDTSFTPVPLAHLTGAAIGILVAGLASKAEG